MFSNEPKSEADHVTRLSITDLTKRGLLDGILPCTLRWQNNILGTEQKVDVAVCRKGGKQICELSYELGSSATGKNGHQCKVSITTTPCHYGGTRRWFLCPMKNDGVLCKKRIAILYLKEGSFGCRHCHHLTYSSQNQNQRKPTNVLMESLKDLLEMQALRSKIKTRRYKGKPTKKYRQFETLAKRYLARTCFTTEE